MDSFLAACWLVLVPPHPPLQGMELRNVTFRLRSSPHGQQQQLQVLREPSDAALRGAPPAAAPAAVAVAAAYAAPEFDSWLHVLVDYSVGGLRFMDPIQVCATRALCPYAVCMS